MRCSSDHLIPSHSPTRSSSCLFTAGSIIITVSRGTLSSYSNHVSHETHKRARPPFREDSRARHERCRRERQGRSLGVCFATPGGARPRKQVLPSGRTAERGTSEAGGYVSLRTEYGTTLRDSFRTSTTARPFRAGFAGSHTLLAHFVRPSSLKGGPKSMARSWRKGLVSSHPPGSSGTRSVPTRLSSLKGEPQSMARSSREGLAGLVVRARLRTRGPGLCRDPLAGLDYGRGFIREQRRR